MRLLRNPATVLSALVVAFILARGTSASAQLLAAKDGPIVYGHHHLNVTNIEEARKFWVDALGGVTTRVGANNVEVVMFPNALLFMRVQKPTAGTKGSTVDHIAFSVNNLRQVVDRIKAGGFRIVTAAEAPPNITVRGDIGVVEGGPVSGIAYALAPDDVKVELVELKAQAAPIISHHVHFFGPQKDMQAWYMKMFGAKELASANPAAFISAGLPGLVMNFAPSPAPVAGTKGRALDHIGFEVHNLEAFVKNLEAQGIKLDTPYRQVPALNVAIAFLTDPWGTFIELTEGLDKIGMPASRASTLPPAFRVDPTWPTIPANWVLGEVSSISVDPHDHVWVLHRPRSVPAEKRAQAAPPVLEFDADGKLLGSWGGDSDNYDWPEREHGIFADAQGFIWISGNGGWPRPTAAGSGDDMILKFTPSGRLVLQIGRRGRSTGNRDQVNVHQPADVFVQPTTNELYVADGYGNQRVVVFDAGDGHFKRAWGAFGHTPPAEMSPNPPAPVPNQGGPDGPDQFGLVHAVKVSNDGIVYVADRTNNRIQTFTTAGAYLRQARLTPEGSATPVPAGFAFSPDAKQRFLYVVDSGPMRVVMFDRETLTPVGSIGMRGPKPGEFDIVHHLAADSKGNLYTAEIVTNRRAQKFVIEGAR
jgi:predicted enzyme related to lactoylglutathione lyase